MMIQVDKTQPIMVIDNEDAWLEQEVKRKIWTGPFDKAVELVDTIYNWGRRSSIWPMQFGLACCAIEMIATGGSRFDIARFGAELFRPSPRQADLMIVAGTVTKKMVPAIVRLYNQMAEPKYVMAMGACASAGGPFKEGYNVVSGIDKFLPVDVYVPGCPPTPQSLLNGLITLQKKIDAQSVKSVPWYQSETHEAIPEPIYGPDLYDPRRVQEIKKISSDPRLMEQMYVHIVARAEIKHGKKEGEAESKPASSKPPIKPATAAAKPAAAPGPQPRKVPETAPIEALKGEVKPIPPTQPDKLMSERKVNPPGQINPEQPRMEGLPKTTPESEAKLEELKADADFAAKATEIHENLAKGTPEAQAAAAKIEAETEEEVRSELPVPKSPDELVEVEPNAMESKEAGKEFEREARKKKDNPK